MLKDTGFCPGVFEARDLMKCSLDQLQSIVKEFVEIVIPLVDMVATPEDKIVPLYNWSHEHHSGSSQYSSADSEIDLDGSFSISQMYLGPPGGSFLKKRKPGCRSQDRAVIRAAQDRDSNVTRIRDGRIERDQI